MNEVSNVLTNVSENNYIFICTRVCIYTYVHVCVCVCSYVLCALMYKWACSHMCVLIYVCVRTYVCVYTQREKGKANEAKYKQLVKRSKRYTDRNPLYSSCNTPVNLILYQNQKLKNI